MKGQKLLDLFAEANRCDDENDKIGAASNLQKLLKLQFNFDHGNPHFWLASLYYDLGQYELAEKYCKNGFRFPRHTDWSQLILYAKISAARGRLDKTLRLIAKAMDSETNLEEDFFAINFRESALIEIAHHWDRYNKLETLFQALEKKSPRYKSIWIKMQKNYSESNIA